MTSDLDIYRTASVLVKRYGEEAILEAAQRTDAMLDKGETGAYLVAQTARYRAALLVTHEFPRETTMRLSTACGH